MRRLSLVQQPTDDTCASACISMLTGIPINTVVSEFHSDFCNHKTLVSDYLESKGFKTKPVNSSVLSEVHQEMQKNHAYLLTVPSLNKEGILHYIVVWLDDTYIYILDPNNGKADKRHYVMAQEEEDSDYDPNGVNLKGFLIDLVLPLKNDF